MLDNKSDRIMSGTSFNVPSHGQKYDTWYDFKRDLETLCGHPVLNTLWLRIKPRTALPWNKSNLRSTLSKLNKD